MRIYRSIPDTLRTRMEHVVMSKSNVNDGRKRLAHPNISQQDIDVFLQGLGDGTPDLDPLDIAMLDYLKIRSNSEDNVKRAARRV